MSKLSNTSLFLVEGADASADVAGSGQLWVDTATPNRFMFTDDAGTDFGVSPTFISSEQTVAVDTGLNVSHGLGAKPHHFTVSAICKTADANYSIGDEIQVWAAMHDAGDAGIMACCDTTNVTINNTPLNILANPLTKLSLILYLSFVVKLFW